MMADRDPPPTRSPLLPRRWRGLRPRWGALWVLASAPLSRAYDPSPTPARQPPGPPPKPAAWAISGARRLFIGPLEKEEGAKQGADKCLQHCRKSRKGAGRVGNSLK